MLAQEEKCLAHDRWIFNNPDETLNQTSTMKPAEWTAMWKPVTLSGMQMAKEQDVSTTHNITKWLKITKDSAINGIRPWKFDHLRYDPYKKKKKRRKKYKPMHQQTMKQYLPYKSLK